MEQLGDNIKSDMNCVSIGTIETFHPNSQTADINLVYKRVSLRDGTITPYQRLITCPVVVLGGGVSYLSFPIRGTTRDGQGNVTQLGDSCLVFFCDREIDTWWANGGVNEPKSTRMHSLNDGVAIVGMRNSLAPISTYGTQIVSLPDITGERLCQAGFIQEYAGSTAPSGWLMCDGSAVSKTTYATLFAVIGITFGDPGGGNFNLPNRKGKVAVGLDATQTEFNALGKIGGEKTHQLTIPELPTHNHTIITWNPSGTPDGYVSGDSGSSHYAFYQPTTENTGSDTPHNNLQPYFTSNFIIKY
jgi:microcystin-dependent protein